MEEDESSEDCRIDYCLLIVVELSEGIYFARQ